MSGKPLWERDPAAWTTHLAEGNTTQARKRVSVDAIIRDEEGRILIVDPTYKPGWDTPGGMAEANEPPEATVRRELREELGLDLTVGPMLCIDWVPPHGPWDDMIAFVFDGGSLTAAQIDALHPTDGEIAGFDFCQPHQIGDRLRPRLARRITAAHRALTSGASILYLTDGRPFDAASQQGGNS
jgi:8-oxo-dGTP diphosphatase